MLFRGRGSEFSIFRLSVELFSRRSFESSLTSHKYDEGKVEPKFSDFKVRFCEFYAHIAKFAFHLSYLTPCLKYGTGSTSSIACTNLIYLSPPSAFILHFFHPFISPFNNSRPTQFRVIDGHAFAALPCLTLHFPLTEHLPL